MSPTSMDGWMDRARQGRVLDAEANGRVRVRLSPEEVVEARPGPAMAERGARVAPGDAVLLAPREDGGWWIGRRFRFEGEREAPLLIRTVDPDVEYLLGPGGEGWTHPYKAPMYDWYDAFDEDLPSWRRLAAEAGDPILELACGAGRVSIDLARAGHRVTGLDISPAMLDLAARKLAREPEAVRARIDWVRADMVDWHAEARYRMAFIACNGLHWMGSLQPGEANELRRRAVACLYEHLRPGGLGVLSNTAPIERRPPPPSEPARYLALTDFGLNPNTGRWTGNYMGGWIDGISGQRYHGPWRFVEQLEDGARRAFEFAPPPARPDEIRAHPRPRAMTRDETVAMLAAEGFRDVELRSPEDLAPADETDWSVVFLARKPG